MDFDSDDEEFDLQHEEKKQGPDTVYSEIDANFVTGNCNSIGLTLYYHLILFIYSLDMYF